MTKVREQTVKRQGATLGGAVLPAADPARRPEARAGPSDQRDRRPLRKTRHVWLRVGGHHERFTESDLRQGPLPRDGSDGQIGHAGAKLFRRESEETGPDNPFDDRQGAGERHPARMLVSMATAMT